jgi:DNA modification methylase
MAKRAKIRVTEAVAKPKAAAKPAEVKITPAKGRPMLVWVGKRPLKTVTAYPAQHVETYSTPDGGTASVDWSDWPVAYPKGGLLFHGDNKEVLAHLLANGFRGKVSLIYIDPPFDSGADYVRKVSLRGAKGTAKIDGESYTLGEQIQYTDIWANDNYLQFMYERLLLLKELLADGGAIFLHCDSGKVHHLRALMDEVFGSEKFVNEIIWSYRRWPSTGASFQAMHDDILFYVLEVGKKRTFHKTYEEASESYMKRFGGKTQKLDEETGTRKITSDEETKGMPLRDVWEISIVAGFKGERTNYPTQKPEALLARIVEASTNPGDLVLDCFIGSGTTAAVAQKLGRRWIGCDINKGAIQTTAKRLQTIIAEQAKDGQPDLGLAAEGEAALKPAQRGFTVWRVNDYDLQIQHNEAANLAVELLGVERTRTDGFFDGTLGKSLVKIASFTHPLTPLDLEDLKRELGARPDEDRPVTVVCLGIEIAAQAWVDEWNALRRGAAAVNKIQVIELRSDPKYGRFIRHEPARAKVKIERKKEEIIVEIQDFISPTIVERLQQQAGVLSPKIDDWRAMVDCVMIDSAYDGKIFNVTLSDVPERKTDLVDGRYDLPAFKGKRTVGVKVIDMLGEEVLVTGEC